MPLNNLLTFRKGTSSEWATTNPILASGEPGYDVTNNILKVGDGTNSYNNLPILFSGIYASGIHNHISSDIIDFNSSVSGLLPTIVNSGDNRILTSTGSSVGINAESNLTFDGNLLNVLGSGSFSSNLNLSSQTVNTVASFDGSKNIVSLNTSTYPSLTELSYVKGVTSSIQTQINGKANSSHSHTSSQITNFNSSVSGLLPLTGLVGSQYISVVNTNRNFTISANGLQPVGNYSIVGHSHTLSNITDAGSLASQNSDNVNISGGTINNFNLSSYSPIQDNIKIFKNNINYYTYFVNIETSQNSGVYNILSQDDDEILAENDQPILTEYYGSRTYIVPSGSLWQYSLKLNVIEDTNNLSSFFNIKGSLKNISGVIDLIGSQTKNSIKEEGMENVDIEVSSVNNILEIGVIPSSGLLLSCGGVLEIVELKK